MSTSSSVGGSSVEEYGSDEDDDLRRAIAESLLSANYESRSESSASTAHHVGDAGDDDIRLHLSTISMTSVKESEESIEKIFAERLSAWEDFMKKVRAVECQNILDILRWIHVVLTKW